MTDPRNLLLLTREALRVWWTLLPAVLGIVGSAAVILIFERAWLLELVVAVAVLLSAFLVLLFGFLGELHLIAAAKAWPRLELYRPHFYKWVTHPWRQAFFPTAGWLLLTLLVSAFLLRRQTIGATIAAACAAALVASVMLVAYVRVRPWRDRSSDELRRVQECRASHQARLQ